LWVDIQPPIRACFCYSLVTEPRGVQDARVHTALFGPDRVVGNGCATASPITLTVKGPINLTGNSTFTGIYTIPNFSHCELNTLLINALIPGPNNTFTATFSPAS